MHDKQHPETPVTNSHEDLLLSKIAPNTALDTQTDHAYQLQIWLHLPTVREQRRFLESHCHLLDEQSETSLHNLLAQEPEGSAQEKQRHAALLLLQDVRRRGGTAEAVREAYINIHGGFVLDIPSWLEVVEQRLTELFNEKSLAETAEARVLLLQQALEKAQEDIPSARELLATLRRELANAWRKHPRTDSTQALETSITFCEEALLIFTVTCYPYQYAHIQNSLGNTYRDRIVGEQRENLEQAIACYHEALRIHTLDAFPFQYAITQNNLGIAYWHRIVGEPRENLERAIACYNETLRVHTLDAFPFDYAITQTNLGLAYRARSVGERRENLECAIACYHEALRVRTLKAFPGEARHVYAQLAEAEAQRGNWHAVQDTYTSALKAEDLLIILGTGTLGRDAILKEGRDAAIRNGYALHRCGRISEAAVAMERGRARGLAEAMTFDAADPTLITNKERRSCYTNVRAALIGAQADLHTPPSPDLDENACRRLDLERTASYRHAKAAFDVVVAEIREANDPADFLSNSLDAASILHTATRIGSEHALVYLVATPWGGVAVAALSEQGSSAARFASLDLPDLSETFINPLIETQLQGSSEKLLGGFALAQMGEGFERVCQQWEGESFQAKAHTLRTTCRNTQQQSTLEQAAQAALACPAFASLAEQTLVSLNREEHHLLAATFDAFFLQHELSRCLERLGTTVLSPVIAWVQEQGVKSLTLIPCGQLAAFPLVAVLLPDGCFVGERLPTSVAPSARSLLQTTTARSPQAGIVTLGDPHDNLPWSEAEALTLTALAQRAALPAEVHLKQQATRERLLAALSSRWIVNACCHGTFDAQDFLQSALHLAHEERVTMAEMLNHSADLRGLRLLLLSACQTALLDLQGARDEGHSLAVAMVQAGAQAVLAAQWAVDDKATYLLMVRFVQEWLPQMANEPPAAALARAQAWLRCVTNEELTLWHSMIATSVGVKPWSQSVAKRRHPEQSSASGSATQWERMPVRGRSARYTVSDAQLIVRIGAERDESSDQPYADPYYWAGFQVIGW